jgi:hypothetical protein
MLQNGDASSSYRRRHCHAAHTNAITSHGMHPLRLIELQQLWSGLLARQWKATECKDSFRFIPLLRIKSRKLLHLRDSATFHGHAMSTA